MIGYITRNISWKLFALLIAVLLWIAVANEPEMSAFVSVPVEFRDLPDTLEISSAAVEKVDLELRGPSGELRNFSGTRTAVVLDMADAQPGERTYTIGEEDARLPRGLTLIRSIPSQVRFVFERRATRTIPVEVRFTQPPARYQVTPPTLTIEGPESHVDRIKSAVTDTVDTGQLSGTGTFHVSAFIDDPYVRIQSDPEVTVEVTNK
jgi:YbbR domain-containing protein